MKNIILILSFGLFFSSCLAFGQDLINPVYIPKSKPGDEEAFKKTVPELERFLVDIRPGMCRVNEVKLEGRWYIVSGTYDFDFNLNSFVAKLKNAATFNPRVYVETKTTMFGGEKSKIYTIYALNLWK
ncbi:MAG TPA: hypothetical protein VNJ08_08220 [Bacteriovoracaceae bacterium]|nr:hypothetical protein [Bacteriovoracaceae bacterium]